MSLPRTTMGAIIENARWRYNKLEQQNTAGVAPVSAK